MILIVESSSTQEHGSLSLAKSRGGRHPICGKMDNQKLLNVPLYPGGQSLAFAFEDEDLELLAERETRLREKIQEQNQRQEGRGAVKKEIYKCCGRLGIFLDPFCPKSGFLPLAILLDKT